MVDAGRDKDVGTKAVAAYKAILSNALDNRPSGTRLKLAAALGKNRSFVSQITNPNYPVPIPVQHIEIIFEVCHLSITEKAGFLDAYHQAHPRRLAGKDKLNHTRTITVTVPDLGDSRKNRALEELIADFAARAARYAEDVG